jgi:hypothetical protein
MDDAELVARILWCTEVVLQGNVERGAVFVDPPSDELRNGETAVPAEFQQAPSMVLHGFNQHATVTLYLWGEPAERVSIVKETLSEHEAFFRIEVRNDTGPVFKGTVHASRSKQAQ